MSDQPKVTLEQWKERVNAGRNTGAGNTQPGSQSVPSGNAAAGSTNGSTPTKSSGNPLHPDPGEELARLRETVSILKRQIYGSSVPGETGVVKHITELEERLESHTGSIIGILNRLGKLEQSFAELIQILGIEEEDGQTQ